MQCFPLPFSVTFVIPNPSSWAGCGRMLSSWLWYRVATGCTSSSVEPTAALLMVHSALRMGFGQDKVETSALRRCYCSALWIWDLTVLSHVQTKHGPVSWHPVSWMKAGSSSHRNPNRHIDIPLALLAKICQVTYESKVVPRDSAKLLWQIVFYQASLPGNWSNTMIW